MTNRGELNVQTNFASVLVGAKTKDYESEENLDDFSAAQFRKEFYSPPFIFIIGAPEPQHEVKLKDDSKRRVRFKLSNRHVDNPTLRWRQAMGCRNSVDR